VFYLSDDASDSSAINESAAAVTVPARTLDSLAANLKAARIRVIAGDAQGAEPEVLSGATHTLRMTEFVSLDCGNERRGEATYETCAKILADAGFEILRHHSRKHLMARNRHPVS
jgi:hypothetical protein